ncbi:MAG: rhodanese-like domain-containing protein [Winogradskyella sp.]|nr:MAG: rhodanese-like domain-containing protein [Winogradskyella sp.]
MKKLVSITLLSFVILSSTSCVDKNADSSDVKLVTADEMKKIIELEDVQLVDVRTPSEFDEIHIESAQNIDFRSPTFEDDITRLDKTKPVLLYCKSGKRSAKCARKLKEAGFEKVYELEGGISKWQYSEILTIEKKS